MFYQLSLSYNKFVYTKHFTVLIFKYNISSTVKPNKNSIFCAIFIAVEHFGNKIFTSIINGNFQMKEYNATHLSVLSMQDLHEKEGV